MQEKNLKPGDRVRLIGWSEEDIWLSSLFRKEDHSFPCETVVYESIFPDESLVLNDWSIKHFTYEIITDGNG